MICQWTRRGCVYWRESIQQHDLNTDHHHGVNHLSSIKTRIVLKNVKLYSLSYCLGTRLDTHSKKYLSNKTLDQHSPTIYTTDNPCRCQSHNLHGYGFYHGLSVFFQTIFQKPMQLRSPNLTQYCSTMSPGISFILGSKGQRSKSHSQRLCLCWDRTQYYRCCVHKPRWVFLAALLRRTNSASYTGFFPVPCRRVRMPLGFPLHGSLQSSECPLLLILIRDARMHTCTQIHDIITM